MSPRFAPFTREAGKVKPNVFLVILQRTLSRFNVSAAARNQQKSENFLGCKFGGGELRRRSSQSYLRSGSSARGPILGSEQEPERHGAVFRSWRRRFGLPFPAEPLQPPASRKYPVTQLLYSSFHLFVHSFTHIFYLAPGAAGSAERTDPACPVLPSTPAGTFHSPSRASRFVSE